MKQIAFILHGKIKGRAKLVSQIKTLFAGPDYQFNIFVSEYAQHAIVLAKQAVLDGHTHIICAGGDGSLNETVNGIMQAVNQGAGSAVKIGVLPYGSGNDFARMLGQPMNLPALKQLIDQNSIKLIDLGLVSFTNPKGASDQRYFINITDIGMGGVIAKKLSSSSRLCGPTLTYQGILLRTFFSYRKRLVKITSPGFEYQGKLMSLVIANGKYFGAGMGIAPDALADDGLLSIVVVGEISLLDYLLNSMAIKNCKKIEHPQVKYFSTRQISAESLNNETCPIDMDGEFIGYTPIDIKLIPNCLSFLWPG